MLRKLLRGLLRRLLKRVLKMDFSERLLFMKGSNGESYKRVNVR